MKLRSDSQPDPPEVMVVTAPKLEVAAFLVMLIVSGPVGAFYGIVLLFDVAGFDAPILEWRIALKPPMPAIFFGSATMVHLVAVRIAIREAWFRCTFTIDGKGITKEYPSGIKQYGAWADIVDAQIWRKRLLFSDGLIMTIQFGNYLHCFGDMIRLSGDGSQLAKDHAEFTKRPGHRLLREYLSGTRFARQRR